MCDFSGFADIFRSEHFTRPFALIRRQMRLCEELWVICDNKPGIFSEPWPTYNKDVLEAEQVEMAIQINGKVRSRVTVASETGEEDLKKRVMEDERVKEFLTGKMVIKIIVVPKKIVNIVAS